MANLIITAPSQGISQSPHVGYADMQGLDIFSYPGIVQLNNVLAKKSVAAVDAQVKWMVRDPDTPGNVFALDSNGVLYKSADSGATWAEVSDRGGSGQGLAVKWGYVFIFEDTTIDVMKISDSSFTDNWQTIDTGGIWHPAIVSNLDGKIYFGAGQYIGTIVENSGQTFAPGTGATYTFVQQALDLPDNFKIRSLTENVKILAGTWRGTNIDDFEIADIFPWDGSSSTFDDPIILRENGCNAMITDGGFTYVFAGVEGNIYKSNGVSIWQIGTIPKTVCNTFNGKFIEVYPGAVMKYKGRIFFGLSGDGTSTTTGGCGVYSFKEYGNTTVLNREHVISTGNNGSASIVIIGALLSISRDSFLCGFRDAAVYGIDLTNTASYGTAATYVSYFDTALYEVGDKNNLHKFQDMMINLVKDMTTNDSIRIQYRVNLTDTFTTLETYTYTHFNNQSPPDLLSYSVNEFIEEKIPACQYIQFRVYLCGTTVAMQLNNISLK